jgi:hypothetical protein
VGFASNSLTGGLYESPGSLNYIPRKNKINQSYSSLGWIGWLGKNTGYQQLQQRWPSKNI